jgi:hypothetical protein
MNTDEMCNGLKQLGFNTGWVVRGNEIVVWNNTEPQPSLKEIEAGLAQFESLKAEQDAKAVADKEAAEAKLAALGLTADDLKALGLGNN